MATTMTIPPLGENLGQLTQLVDALGIKSSPERKYDKERWVITFQEDLTQDQMDQVEALVAKILSGVEWS